METSFLSLKKITERDSFKDFKDIVIVLRFLVQNKQANPSDGSS